ncbi:hypothetical protein BJY00DRAFT_318611 [Aspergillus carlsbadensis]|nr:hypothetical protein BJY00DRAFT_318611 [Aspergillus carlsbadensis]
MPPRNDERPETDYERWLRERKPGFHLGEEPLYEASEGNVYGLEKGRGPVAREISVLPLPTQVLNDGDLITPSHHREYGLSPGPGALTDWLNPHFCCWIIVSGLVIVLLAIVIRRASTAYHRDGVDLRAGHRKPDKRDS